MDATRELQDALGQFIDKRTPSVLTYGKVKSYDSSTETVVVTDLITDLDTFDVGLKSVQESDTEGVVIVPKIGSMVIIGALADGRFTILRYSKVEKIKGKIGTVVFDISADGVQIERGTESLKTVLSDFMQEAFVSSSAIQAVLGIPTNTGQYTLLKNRLNQILK